MPIKRSCFRMDMRDDEANELSFFLGSLEMVRLVEGVEDTRKWVGGSFKDIFS